MLVSMKEWKPELCRYYPLVWFAYRDGIIGRPDEPVTRGLWGPVALSMLDGDEVILSHDDEVSKYTVRGPMAVSYSCLMATEGRPIRILRGHELQSELRPSKGLRYDGL